MRNGNMNDAGESVHRAPASDLKHQNNLHSQSKHIFAMISRSSASLPLVGPAFIIIWLRLKSCFSPYHQ